MSSAKKSKTVSTALAVLCNKNSKHFIHEDYSEIGRSPAAFLCAYDNHISRKHCVIEKSKDNKFTICDMSNYGTFVNDQRLIKHQAQELNHLDRIKLADLDAYSYVFMINKKHLGIKSPQKFKRCSSLTEKMDDLNETQSLEKDCMDEELSLVKTDLSRLKEEMQQKLKAREDELEQERLMVSLESAYNKEQADKANIKLKETIEEKERVMKEYEEKILDVTKKVEELQKTKTEMGKRHQTERDELETRCKAEIEELKMKLEKSEIEHQQFKELQERLEETKNVLLESELEQQRLFEAKVEVETKLESKIVDLTNERDEQVKELEKKQKEKQEFEERIKKEIEGLEEDMLCSICAELYIEPTALNCGHMFCKLCITEWSKKKKICPMCRAKISTTVRIFNMDSVIQRNIRLMPEETLSRREALIAERKKSKSPPKKQSAKKRRQTRYPREFSPPSPPPLTLAEIRDNMSRSFRQDNFRRIMPFQPRVVPGPQESEGADPFQAGWVTTPAVARNISQADRNSPVTVAAVDLTNIPMIEVPSPSWARTHTVTSADANNTTIDLTDL